MEHYTFFIINFLLFTILMFIDRKRIKDYLWLICIGLVFAYIFESVTTYLGFWIYYSEPKIPLISLYTWLLYAPYLSFCYFIGQYFGGDNE